MQLRGCNDQVVNNATQHAANLLNANKGKYWGGGDSSQNVLSTMGKRGMHMEYGSWCTVIPVSNTI